MIGGTRDATAAFFFWRVVSTVLCTCSFRALFVNRWQESSVCGPFVAFAALVMMQREGIVTPCNVAEEREEKNLMVSKNNPPPSLFFFFFFFGAMTLSFFAVVLSHFVEALLTTVRVVFRAKPLPSCPCSPSLPFSLPSVTCFAFSHNE